MTHIFRDGVCIQCGAKQHERERECVELKKPQLTETPPTDEPEFPEAEPSDTDAH